MAKWMMITASEVQFEEVSGADVHGGVLRYVIQRNEDDSFSSVIVDGQRIQPASSMVYVQGNAVHIQVS